MEFYHSLNYFKYSDTVTISVINFYKSSNKSDVDIKGDYLVVLLNAYHDKSLEINYIYKVALHNEIFKLVDDLIKMS